MIHLTVTVADTADLLAVQAYGPGALLRWEWATLEAGTYTEGGTVALVAGTSLYDVWHTAGTETTWYRTRVSNAGGSTFSAYSAAFQAGADGPGMSVDQLRTFVTSALDDSALALYLQAAADAILEVTGAVGDTTEYLGGTRLLRRLTTGRLIGTVTSVTEDDVVLAADDYRVSGYVLTRLDDGTNPRTYWGDDVIVVYGSPDDTAEFQRVQLELVKLDLAQNPGVTQETIGTWSESYGPGGDYAVRRADILATLGASSGGMWVE